MHKQQAQHSNFLKDLRAKKLEALGKTGSGLGSAHGTAQAPIKEMVIIEEGVPAEVATGDVESDEDVGMEIGFQTID